MSSNPDDRTILRGGDAAPAAPDPVDEPTLMQPSGAPLPASSSSIEDAATVYKSAPQPTPASPAIPQAKPSAAIEDAATVYKTAPAPATPAVRPPAAPAPVPPRANVQTASSALDAEGATVLQPGRGATSPGTTPPPQRARAVTGTSHGKTGTGRSPTLNTPSFSSSPSQLTADDTAHTPGDGKTPKPGTRIDHYELIRQLGKGGMGTVFLARDTRLGRRVAIKFLQTNDPEMTQRFILEARTTARCNHENIVTIYDVGEFKGSPYMVLEFLQGQPLTKLLLGGAKLPFQRAVELMVPVVRALAVAHEQGIVHRDLKPDNIILTDSGTIKVLDFGIAKVLGSEERSLEHVQEMRGEAGEATRALMEDADEDAEITGLTRHGAIMGTLAFMSPEQWGIGVPIDHRTDIWAVGIMLYRMLVGQHPLHPLRGEQLYVTAKLDQPMPRLRDRLSDIPPELAEVVDACLIKDKEKRTPDALALLRGLERFLPGRFTRELKIDESPYAGLSSFQESDADRFFGRAHEIAAMVNRIRDQPLIGVVGPSGTGKSSVVRAGLVPALKRSGENWETLVIRPGRNPMSALANIVAPLLGTSSNIQDDLQAQQKLAERIRTEPGYVGSVLRSRARREKTHILLFVDQFEELYTNVADEEERRAFTACLSGVADDATSPIRVVLSIRSDFLDRVPEDQQFMTELTQGLFFLTSPNREGLRDALVQPAEMAGYRFESPAIVDDMLEHLHATQGALPLLQFCAAKLWESRDPARKLLTESSYRSIGGIAGALASHADAVLNELAGPARNLVRAIFLRLVTPERTRAIASVSELLELSQDAAEIQRIVDLLVQARLLVVQSGGGSDGASVEIVHESLIHSWPTLKRWLDETGEDSAFLEQLRNAARQWQAKGHDSGLLWRGEMVEEAERFQRRYRGELPKVQREFLEAVFLQARRGKRLKQALTVGSVVFLSLLVAASAVALVIINSAQKEAVRQAAAAREAEGLARQQKEKAEQALVEVQQKERERAEAAEAAEAARRKAEEFSAQLQGKNVELLDALKKAEQARRAAWAARSRAESSALAARRAREEALRAAKELEEMLLREQERVKRLESQLGSPVIDELK